MMSFSFVDRVCCTSVISGVEKPGIFCVRSTTLPCVVAVEAGGLVFVLPDFLFVDIAGEFAISTTSGFMVVGIL